MKQLIFISFVSFCSSFGWSQKIVRSSISTMGFRSKTNNVLVQSTVGQSSLTTTEKSGEGLVLRQGFQQPTIIESEQNDLNVVVYPNPSNGDFTNESKEISIPNPRTGIYHLAVKYGALQSSFKITLFK